MADRKEDKLVTVFGGSGFVGRHVVRALAARGWRVRVAVRRPDLAFFLQPIGAVGQIHSVQANLRFPDSVARALAGADAVVNLVGILAETGRQKFAAVQADGARAVAEAAAAAGIDRLVHVSAIGADADSPAAYAKSKAEGEAAVLKAVPQAVVLRPSIIFGPEDDFFNRFGAMATMTPVVPLVGAETKFQPVFVGDVAEAVATAVSGGAEPGTVYELGGPEVKSFKACIEQMLAVIGRDRATVSIPFMVARFQAWFLEKLPKPLLTVDQVKLLQHDNVVSDAASRENRTLEDLGIKAQTMTSILPTYLTRFKPHGEFDSARVA